MARITDPNDFLIHYGVLGMKWGKRKTTNTASPSAMKTHTPFSKNPGKDPPPAKGVTDLRPKHIKRISDVELRNRINRIQMETQYKQLTEGKADAPKSKLDKATKAYDNFEKGHKAVKNILAVAKTMQSIYKLYDSNEIRMLRGVESKEDEAKRKNKDK